MAYLTKEQVAAALLAAAFCISIVLGVASFTAGGPPTAPDVRPVRVIVDPSNGVATLIIYVSCVTYSTQPPNSIDNLGMKVVFSVWQDGVLLVDNQSSALGVISGHGQRYTVGTTLFVLLDSSDSNLSRVVLQVTAQVPTYVGEYFSPTVTEDLGNVHAFGPQRDVAPQFYFNVYGPFAGTSMLWLGVAFVLMPKPRYHAEATDENVRQASRVVVVLFAIVIVDVVLCAAYLGLPA